MIYFGLGSKLYGAIETTVFAHPILLYVLFMDNTGIFIYVLRLRKILARGSLAHPFSFGPLAT
ncbi:MAG: hypothetical protein DRJ98_00910 [Thermoprotei archaeon]|nr:MAG: hypothetical protein DRJ98_00910 [Thermoprotei archaeon]